MPSTPLEKVPFSASHLSSQMVQGFDCGPNPWEKEITDWLKLPPGQGGACDDVLVGGNFVWLYVAGGDLVGIGSLGPAACSWPKHSSPRVQATCLANLAVDSRHRRKGYGAAILDDMISQAQLRKEKFPIVVLYVDQKNPAIGLYQNQKYNFATVGKPYIDPKSGRSYLRMAVKI